MDVNVKSALVLIDVQVGIDEAAHWGGNRNNPEAEENILKLLRYWRSRNLPVIIVKHDSVSPGSPFWPDHKGNALKSFVTVLPGEKLIRKSTANAFIKTDFLSFLEQQGITELVITGFVTNNSVEATARYSGDQGISTVVVRDATACFDKRGSDGSHFDSRLIHQISLSNLEGEYATILTTEDVIRLNKYA